jgi:hypothetical protein
MAEQRYDNIIYDAFLLTPPRAGKKSAASSATDINDKLSDF